MHQVESTFFIGPTATRAHVNDPPANQLLAPENIAFVDVLVTGFHEKISESEPRVNERLSPGIFGRYLEHGSLQDVADSH